MSLRNLLSLALCAALAVLCGCGKSQPTEGGDASAGAPPPGEQMPAAATDAAPGDAAATDAAATDAAPADGPRTSYDKLGVSLAMPAGWNKAPAQEGVPEDVMVNLQRGESEIPGIMVTGFDAETSKMMRTKDGKEITLDEFIEQQNKDLMKEDGSNKKPELVDQGDWTAPGIAGGKRMKMKGPVDDKGEQEGFVELRIGEATDGGLYIVMARATSEDDLAEAVGILDSAEFTGAKVGIGSAMEGAKGAK